MGRLLPEAAWDEGFTSRTIFVYSPTADNNDISFDTELIDDDDIVHDLRSMMTLFGHVIWDDDAQAAVHAWCQQGQLPIPTHARLAHYNSRRLTHAVKLGLIASIARSNSMIVTLKDFETALQWLLEAEEHMPEIFQKMTVTRDTRIMDDTHYHMTQLYEKLNGPVPEYYLIDYLRQRLAPRDISKFVEVMCKAKMMESNLTDGVIYYRPL